MPVRWHRAGLGEAIVPASELPAYQDPRRRLDGLQALRAVAAGLVMLFHVSLYPQQLGVSPEMAAIFGLEFGLLGVCIFFAISGYLMSSAVRQTDACTFLVHRILRIYPVFLVVLFIFVALRGRYDFQPLATTLVPVGPGLNYNLGVEWTLQFEVSFYIFLFFCSLFGAARFMEAIGAVWLVLLACASIALPPLQTLLTPTILELPLVAANVGFAGGLFLPWLIRRSVMGPAAAVLALVCAMLSIKFGFGAARWLSGVSAILLVGLVVTWDRHLGRQPSPGSSLAGRFGDWSYALYLCHTPVSLWVLEKIPLSSAWSVWLLAIAVSLAVAAGVGMLDVASYRSLKRLADGSPLVVRQAVAIAYCGGFLAMAGWGVALNFGRE